MVCWCFLVPSFGFVDVRLTKETEKLTSSGSKVATRRPNFISWKLAFSRWTEATQISWDARSAWRTDVWRFDLESQDNLDFFLSKTSSWAHPFFRTIWTSFWKFSLFWRPWLSISGPVPWFGVQEAKTEIQAELRKSQAMVQRLQNEVNMAKQPTESMRDLTDWLKVEQCVSTEYLKHVGNMACLPATRVHSCGTLISTLCPKPRRGGGEDEEKRSSGNCTNLTNLTNLRFLIVFEIPESWD